jgi:hypothetical protein
MKVSVFIALILVAVTVTVAVPLADSKIALGDDLQNDAFPQTDDEEDLMIAADDQESTSCAGCGAGTWFSGGRCQPCHKGRYNSGCIAKGPMCTLCPTGTSTSGTGSRSLADCTCGPNMFFNADKCTQCPSGHEFNPSSSKPGATSAADCTPCIAGFARRLSWVAPGAAPAACSACSSGTFSATTGSNACTDCPKGTYSDGVANKGCMACPASGSTTVGTRSKSLSDCVCGANLFLKSATECAKCPTGTQFIPSTSKPGANSVSDCKPICGSNQFFDAKDSKCTNCPAGTQFIASTSKPVATAVTDCTPCAAGSAPQFAALGRSGEGCHPCPRGSFAANPGSAVCTACASGTIASYPGSKYCTSCPANTESKGLGQSSTAGFFCCSKADWSTKGCKNPVYS